MIGDGRLFGLPLGQAQSQYLVEPHDRGFLQAVREIASDQVPDDGHGAGHVQVAVHHVGKALHVFPVGFSGGLAPAVDGQPEPVQLPRGALDAFPLEVELGPVTRAQAEQPVDEGIVAPVDKRLHPQEPARGFRHLGVSQLQEIPVHPVVCEPRAVACLGLGDLVRMVHRDMVLAAQMDVEKGAEVLGGHGRAFDVPAREPDAPGAVPLHLPLLARRAELPQGEVGYAALLRHVDPRAGLEPFHVQAGEITVIGLFRGVEVDTVRGPVGEPLLFDTLDLPDLFGDMVGGPAPRVRLQDVQPTHVIFEDAGVVLGDLPGRLAGAPRTLLHLVLARIRVGGQVPHVGDVHHVTDLVSVERKRPAQQVAEHVRAHVADVGEIVDRGTAGVETHLVRGQRLELAETARVGVVEGETHGLWLRSVCSGRLGRSGCFGPCQPRQPLRTPTAEIRFEIQGGFFVNFAMYQICRGRFDVKR